MALELQIETIVWVVLGIAGVVLSLLFIRDNQIDLIALAYKPEYPTEKAFAVRELRVGWLCLIICLLCLALVPVALVPGISTDWRMRLGRGVLVMLEAFIVGAVAYVLIDKRLIRRGVRERLKKERENDAQSESGPGV